MMQASPGRPDRTDRNDRPDQYDRPRFRQDDLVAESIEEQGGRFIDVMDPDSGTVFRFYEVEYSLACAMDGERDVPGIVKWAQEELGLSPSPQEVRTVIAALGDLGFIATGGAVAQAHVQATDQPAHSVVPPQAKAHAPIEHAPGPAASGAQASASVSADSAAAHVAPASAARRPAPTPAQTSTPAPTPAPVQPPAQEPAQEPILTLDVDDGEPDRPLAPSGRNPARPTPGPPEPSSKDISEVSIDLSDHIEVRPDDVKEAVRASRVMAAVEAPPDQDVEDMINAIDERVIKPSDGPTPATKPPEAKPETTRSTKQPENTRSTKQPENTRTAKPPVELPNAPNVKPVQPPAPSARMNPIFIVLLILVVLGGGGFAVWKFVLQKPDSGGDTGTSQVPAPVKPTPPPPPPAPTTKVVMEASAPEDVKTNQGGVIDTIVADNTAVKEGDEILRFTGAKQVEAEKGNITRDKARIEAQRDTWKTRLEKAQASNNKAAEEAAKTEIADREKAIAAKDAQYTAKDEELKKFKFLAPASGIFTQGIRSNTKILPNQVVGKLQRSTTPAATFKVSDTKLFAANMNVEVTVSKGDQPVTCTVTDVQAGSVKVVCPVDSGLTEGADVTLKSGALEAAPAPSGSDTK